MWWKKKDEKELECITYSMDGSFYPIKIKEIEDLRNDPGLSMKINVTVKNLAERVCLTFNDASENDLMDVGIESSIFYGVKCDKKGVELSFEQILNTKWEYGENLCLFPDPDNNNIDDMMNVEGEN